jgi:hypothetical protein
MAKTIEERLTVLEDIVAKLDAKVDRKLLKDENVIKPAAPEWGNAGRMKKQKGRKENVD